MNPTPHMYWAILQELPSALFSHDEEQWGTAANDRVQRHCAADAPQMTRGTADEHL